MGIDVRYASETDLDQWDDFLTRSLHPTPFHLLSFLETLAEHSNATLHLFIGYKGQEPAGVFPMFEITRGPISTVFSPTPNWKIPSLGPVMFSHNATKQRKSERDTWEFIEKSLSRISDECNPKYVLVRTGPGYVDIRPFRWQGFNTTVGYTYIVDLTIGESALLESFSRDARNNIRCMDDADCVVQEDGIHAIDTIITQLKERHNEQNEHYGVTPAFVTDLYRRMPEGSIRVYTCTVDDTIVGGMITLEFGDTIYRWQGGAKPDVDFPVNDYLDWTIMCDASDRGLARYDLVGAINRRLTKYKAKFNPELASQLTVYQGSPTLNLASGLYKRLR